MSNDLANLTVRECKASNFTDCDLVFSGLDSDVAGDVGRSPMNPTISILTDLLV